MKKLGLTLVMAMMAVMLVAGGAWAIPFGDGGAALQGVLDNHTVGGPSSVDVTTDALSDQTDSYWSVEASGGALATMIIELAGFAPGNTFGIFDMADHSKTVQLFAGANDQGDKTLLSIYADGSIEVNFFDTGIDFASNAFGFYLNSSMYTNGGFWYSDTSLNSDQTDHLAVYQGVGDQFQILPYAAGVWGSNEYVLAFEDLTSAASDFDYTDMVVMVESVNPVPEPGTMALLGIGLLGLAFVGRKKLKIKE